MSIKKEILELINDSYEVEISGFSDITEDNFKDGASINQCNYFDNEKISFSLDNLDNFETIIKDKIKDYLEDKIYYYEDVKEEDISIIDDRLCLCQMVDNDNSQPSKYEFEQFERGKINLYIQDINIYVSINGTTLNENILRAIYANAS